MYFQQSLKWYNIMKQLSSFHHLYLFQQSLKTTIPMKAKTSIASLELAGMALEKLLLKPLGQSNFVSRRFLPFNFCILTGSIVHNVVKFCFDGGNSLFAEFCPDSITNSLMLIYSLSAPSNFQHLKQKIKNSSLTGYFSSTPKQTYLMEFKLSE